MIESITFEDGMDLKQLRAFLTVAETGNMTRAAQRLHLVQPAVSRQVALLEQDLGVSLFLRHAQGMALTAEGQALIDPARRALHELEKARAQLAPAGASPSGVVDVALLPSTCDVLSARLVQALSVAHPGIRVRISSGYAGVLQKWLEAGEVDVAMLYDAPRAAPISVQRLLEERLWVIGRPEDGLRASRPMRLSTLVKRRLILPSRPHGLRSLLEHACALKGLELNVVAETNAMSVQRRLVIAGYGLTVLPTIAVSEDIVRGVLSAAPLSDPPIARQIVLAVSNQRTATPVTQIVTRLLKQCMREAVEEGEWLGARWLAATAAPPRHRG